MDESCEGGGRGGLSDDEARAIARRIVGEVYESPQDHDRMAADTPRGGSTSADEARIERALVELGAADSDGTTMADPLSDGMSELLRAPDGGRADDDAPRLP